MVEDCVFWIIFWYGDGSAWYSVKASCADLRNVFRLGKWMRLIFARRALDGGRCLPWVLVSLCVVIVVVLSENISISLLYLSGVCYMLDYFMSTPYRFYVLVFFVIPLPHLFCHWLFELFHVR